MLISHWENQSEQISVARKNIFVSMIGGNTEREQSVRKRKINRLDFGLGVDKTILYQTEPSGSVQRLPTSM